MTSYMTAYFGISLYQGDAWKEAKEAHEITIKLFNPDGKPNVCMFSGTYGGEC